MNKYHRSEETWYTIILFLYKRFSLPLNIIAYISLLAINDPFIYNVIGVAVNTVINIILITTSTTTYYLVANTRDNNETNKIIIIIIIIIT